MVAQHLTYFPLICHLFNTYTHLQTCEDESNIFHIISVCACPRPGTYFQTNQKWNTPLSANMLFLSHPFTGYVSWMFAFLLFLTHLPISWSPTCLNCSEGTACVCLDHNVATMPSRHSAWIEGVRQSLSPSDRPLYPPPFPPSFPSPLKPLANYLFLFSLPLCSFCAIFIWGGLLVSHVGFFLTTSAYQLMHCLHKVIANTFVCAKTEK